MKKFIETCLAVAVIFLGNSVHAENVVKGKVEFIRTHDASQLPQWSPPTFWFTLKGVSKAGSCKKWGEGKVIFVANDTQAFNLVSNAMNGGKEIAVVFDDSILHSDGWCMASYITVGSPPPLY